MSENSEVPKIWLVGVERACHTALIMRAFIISGLASYLLGAVPFGYLLGLTKGVDIRRMGSGNIGATNVARCLGKGWGALVFICDALKGFIPAFFFPSFAASFSTCQNGEALALLCAAAAVVGHNWPIFLKFKGGKGVATSLGALLGIAPACAGIAALTWAIAFVLTRYVSVASIAAAAAAAAAAWIMCVDSGPLVPSVLSILAAVAIWRHRSNIQRLIKGTEHRFKRGADQKQARD